MYHLKRAAQKTLKKNEKQKVKSFWMSNRISASPLCPHVSFFTQLLQSRFMYRRREKAFESSWAWSVWRYLHLYSCTETQWDAAYDGRLLVPGSLLSDVVRRSGLFQAYWTLNPLLGFLWSWQQSSVVSLRHLKNCKGIRNKLSDTIAIWFEDTVLPQQEKKQNKWTSGWPGE